MRLDPSGQPRIGVRYLDGEDLPAIERCPFCGTSARWFSVPDARSAEMVPEHRGIMCPNQNVSPQCPRPWISYPTGWWEQGIGNYTVNQDEALAQLWNRRPE